MFHRRFLQPTFLMIVVTCLFTATAAAQIGDGVSTAPSGKVPADVILVKGAEPGASDHSTAVPEDGRVSHNIYRSSYLGLTYPLAEGWTQSYDGPPPSDTGEYVLAQLVPGPAFKGSRGTVLVTTQDLFFSRTHVKNASEMVRYSRSHLPSYYEPEREPAEVQIAGRSFVRYDYMSPVVGIHWYVLTTEVRCHALQFVFMGQDAKMLESLVADMSRMELPPVSAPVCVANYVKNAEVKVDPVFAAHNRNAIPVRMVIDKKGNVRHVHVISAFPDQTAKIIEALMQWKFRPADTEIETGIVFGEQMAEVNANVD